MIIKMMIMMMSMIMRRIIIIIMMLMNPREHNFVVIVLSYILGTTINIDHDHYVDYDEECRNCVF